MNTADHLVFVATKETKVLGILGSLLETRIFCQSSQEGRITDFYILAEGGD